MTGLSLMRLGLLVLLGLVVVAGPCLAAVNVPDDYRSIQAAINAVSLDPGSDGIIEVEPDTYNENLEIPGGITLRGREAARTILRPATETVPLVKIQDAANVIFANFTLSNAQIGVQVSSSLNVVIASTVFDIGAEGQGVDVSDNSTVSVINNVFFRNAVAVTRPSSLVEVRNNIFSGNGVTVDGDFDGAAISFNCYLGNDDDDPAGSDARFGDPKFVDTSEQDFHLRQDSFCIDNGFGIDVIDNTVADMGAYGGGLADPFPFPVQDLSAQDGSAAIAPPYNIQLSWSANESYLVTHDDDPGGYRVYYDSDVSGPPYDGEDARDGSGQTTPSPIDVGDVTSYELRDLAPNPEEPDVPVLLEVAPSNGTLSLRWSVAARATGYVVYYGIGDVSENRVEVGNVTQYDITGLVNGVTYQVVVSAVAQTRYYIAVTAVDSTFNQHESDFSDERSLALGPVLESDFSNTLTGTPQNIIPVPDLPDEGCFIATAAFGTDTAPALSVLREFRDRYLKTSALGRYWVRLYYTHGPRAARFVQQHPMFKPAVRLVVWPLVMIALVVMHGTLSQKAFVVFLTVVLLGRIIFRIRKLSER